MKRVVDDFLFTILSWRLRLGRGNKLYISFPRSVTTYENFCLQLSSKFWMNLKVYYAMYKQEDNLLGFQVQLYDSEPRHELEVSELSAKHLRMLASCPCQLSSQNLHICYKL